jgi:hypothetical protein
MLNVDGRWSSYPTPEVPVLVWSNRALAEDAEALSRTHRGSGIVVSTYNHSGHSLGKELVLFNASHEATLAGYLPYDQAAMRKAEVARLKALASAAYLLARSTGDTQLEERARSLSSKAGAGAAEYLTGKTGSNMVKLILAGTVAADAVVTREHVAAAVELAKSVITARDHSGGFGRRTF